MTLEETTNLIDQYRKKSEASLSQVAEAPASTDFAEQLRTRLTGGEDISNLISNIAQQRSRLLSIPAETRAEAPIGVYSPTQVAGLVAQREEPVRATWETLMGVKQAREGRMEEVITRATQGYEAQIQKQQTKYEQERQKLQDLMDERNWISQQAQQASQQAQQAMKAPEVIGTAETGYRQWNPKTRTWESTGLGGGTTGTNQDLVNAIIINPSLYNTLSATKRNEVLPQLQTMGFDVTKLLPSTTFAKASADAISSFNSAESMLDTLLTKALDAIKATSEINAWKERVTLNVQAISPNTSAGIYKNILNSFLAMLTRASGEKGVLTEKDVSRIKNALPSFGMTRDTVTTQIQTLKGLFNSIKTGAIEAYGGGTTSENDPLEIR